MIVNVWGNTLENTASFETLVTNFHAKMEQFVKFLMILEYAIVLLDLQVDKNISSREG
jgi:hypothetical protein